MSVSNPPTPQQLQWLRRLLDDRGEVELEQALAGDGQTEFFVRSPPIVQNLPVKVQVNGITLVQGPDFNPSSELDSIIFTNPPPTGGQILIRYTRQTWTDDELNGYLVSATGDWTADRHLVYQAAIFAVDGLLSGAATAFDFGEGQETFAFSSVYDRLKGLRDDWETWLENNGQWGQIVVSDMTFDSLSPGDIDDDTGDEYINGGGGIFIEQPGYWGGLNG